MVRRRLERDLPEDTALDVTATEADGYTAIRVYVRGLADNPQLLHQTRQIVTELDEEFADQGYSTVIYVKDLDDPRRSLSQ